MDLDRALLEQAELLLGIDRTRPKQVNLRRAVSAVYYSVYHLLVAEATGRVVGERAQGPLADELRAQVSRWFGHAEMKRVCEWFGTTGSLPPDVAILLRYPRPGIVPTALARLCDTFVNLQEERHRADYGITYSPMRLKVVLVIDRARIAFDDTASLRDNPVYNLFLGMLLTGDRVVRAR